jgi:hypothetical protein
VANQRSPDLAPFCSRMALVVIGVPRLTTDRSTCASLRTLGSISSIPCFTATDWPSRVEWTVLRHVLPVSSSRRKRSVKVPPTSHLKRDVEILWRPRKGGKAYLHFDVDVVRTSVERDTPRVQEVSAGKPAHHRYFAGISHYAFTALRGFGDLSLKEEGV